MDDSKKFRDMAKQLELAATFFFWWLGIEVSFLPTMINHHVDGNKTVKSWENTTNKVLVSFFVLAILNFIEKIIIQLIAISFHMRTYADRIEVNRFQIASLVKLYSYSKRKISAADGVRNLTNPDRMARALERQRQVGLLLRSRSRLRRRLSNTLETLPAKSLAISSAKRSFRAAIHPR